MTRIRICLQRWTLFTLRVTSDEDISYGEALLAGFEWLLANDANTFVIGQGLWSPWYVGNSMTDLDKKFGVERIIDTPVSESAVTGAGVGAALAGKRPIVVHPRMDFMLYAMDAIVNQAAKWRHMIGGQATVPITVRGIINRGGEQGAQHSQALRWYAHIPGLRGHAGICPGCARSSDRLSLVRDPVVFIDDRWLYDLETPIEDISKPLVLAEQGPEVVREGTDVTVVAASHSVRLSMTAAERMREQGVAVEVIDVRVISPLKTSTILKSARKTGRVLCVDGGWSPCGFAAELMAVVAENLRPDEWRASPRRLTLPFAPAPTSHVLEAAYYPTTDDVCKNITTLLEGAKS